MVFDRYNITLALLLMITLPIFTMENIRSVEEERVDVGLLVKQLVEHHISGCHLTLLFTTEHSPIFYSLIRSKRVDGVVLVEAGEVLSQDQLDQDHLLQGLWGDTRTTCRALILDLTSTTNNNDSTHLSLRMVETMGLWRRSETRVLVVGGRSEVRAVLLHPGLRNTVHALYMAVQDFTPRYSPQHGGSRLKTQMELQAGASDRVWTYQRCMYCKEGGPDVKLKSIWKSGSNVLESRNLFREQLQTLMGHRLRVVSVPHFPYMDYDADPLHPGSIVKHKDAVDTRLIYTFASALNFTFEIREEPNRTWGLLLDDGMFTGMMGQLQREETDFCTIAGPSPERLEVVEYLRGYPSDLMTVISLKPTLLPKHLSLMRPFEGELWLALLVIVVAWGVILWLLHRAWWWVAGGPKVWFNTALLYGWGALMEQPPSDPSVNMSGRMLVGWWLVFCLVIDAAYRSSMIAHMTVQGKTRPMETFQDLVKQGGWKWGTEPWLLKGVPYDYFSKHTDPVVQEIFRKMEVLGAKEALQKVLQGGYSLLDWENYLTIVIASQYTDTYGNTPFYMSKKGVSIMAAFGWGFRKGAPFYPRFSQLMFRLQDAGIIDYWIDDVIARRVRKNREAAALDPQAGTRITSLEDNEQVVLGLQHLQGAFYLLLLGSGVAFLALVVENFVDSCSVIH